MHQKYDKEVLMQKYNRLPAGTLAVRSDAVGTVVAAVYSWHIILSLPTYESYTLYTTICLEGSIVNRCPGFSFLSL